METTDILDSLVATVEEIAHDAIDRFKNAIREKRLILTEDLERNFRFELTRSATALALVIEFRGYGRFKDMAQLRYGGHIAPPDEMEEYVKLIGLDRFAYVQGYKGQQVPTVHNAARRIGWAIATGRKKISVVKRGYSGTWYNASKMDMINQAKKQLARRYAELIAPYVIHSLEGDP